MTAAELLHKNWCPYCPGDMCQHFIGWTADGVSYQRATETPQRIEDTDRIITTGVSARVYRPISPALLLETLERR